MRILCVDDEKTSLLIVESLAAQLGYRVDSFLRPSVALERVAEDEYDMMLVDYMMPEMSGIEFIREVRKSHPDIPIVMVTGTIEDRELKVSALEAGASEFLQKPIDIVEFRARITALSRLREAQLLLRDRAKHLESEVEKATRRILEREHETLTTLGRAAEYRDPETGAHIARVAHYSRLIGEKHGLPSDELDVLFRAAPLHDIGKIGISDTILLKPGKLTDEEFAQIREHTTIGRGIIGDSGSAYLAAGAAIAYTHHEHYDGTGYPAGVGGEEIHLFGRIVAIADVFDALTSERPYKQPWSLDRALEHIGDEAGTHFDPVLAQYFYESESRVREIYREFGD